MQTSRSPEISFQNLQLRQFRFAVLNGFPVHTITRAQLEARGIDTSDLEARLIQNQEFTR